MKHKRAQKICHGIVDKYYPGYYLLMDRLSRDAYASLWGLGTERVEIVFANDAKEGDPVYMTKYELTKNS